MQASTIFFFFRESTCNIVDPAMVRVESSFDNGEGLNLVQFAGRDLKRLIKILKTARESG